MMMDGFLGLILDLCMLENKTMPFFVRDLVWFKSCVVGFLMNILSVLYFFCVWSVFLDNFLSFYVFFMFNFSCFSFVFGSTQSGQINQVKLVKSTQLDQNQVNLLYPICFFFFQCFELLCCEPLPLKA